jgi:hypothetical protein
MMGGFRAAFLVLALAGCASASPANVPVVLDTDQAVITYTESNGNRRSWRLNPSLNPDTLEVLVRDGQRERVCFISERAEACFDTAIGDIHDFVIVRDGIAHNTRIVGVRDVPAAVFSPAYQAEHRGRIEMLVPEAYELVNVAIALTDHAAANPGLVITDTDYYRDVEAHFGALRAHPFVQALNARMTENAPSYFDLKMNGYAFEYEASGRIVRSSVYDRTGFSGYTTNALLPLLADMQAFSDASNFREFYAAHRQFYASQIAYLRDSVDSGGMLRWLQSQFPAVRRYDGVKVIFSPLVGYSQSLTTFDYDGYRELQPHVNFPYGRLRALSPRGQAIYAGLILFTEMNHGFIGPTADNYFAEIDAAIGSRDLWIDDTKSGGYYADDSSLFNEYMNWGLISLYDHDLMSGADFAIAKAGVERAMVEGRGFRKFGEFNQTLVDLYLNRAPGQTVADLYPAIIAWFAAQSAGGAAQAP